MQIVTLEVDWSLWRSNSSVTDVTSPFPPSGNEGYIRNRDVILNISNISVLIFSVIILLFCCIFDQVNAALVSKTTNDTWRFSTAWYGTVRFSTAHFWGGFHWVQYLVPSTFFSTTSAEVPSEPYRYQNVTCKLCWSPIGRRKSSLPASLNLRHVTQ